MKMIMTVLVLALATQVHAAAAAGERTEQDKVGVLCQTVRSSGADAFIQPVVWLPSTYYSSGPNSYTLTVETEEVKIVSSVLKVGDQVIVMLNQTSKKSGELTSTDATLARSQVVKLNHASRAAMVDTETPQINYMTECIRTK